MAKKRVERTVPGSPPRAREPTSKARSTDYLLRLFVCGLTPRSVTALANIRQICQEYLRGRHELEVVDMYQHPELVKREQIVGAPTLIKTWPLPEKRSIGDMRDRQRVLAALELPTTTGQTAAISP